MINAKVSQRSTIGFQICKNYSKVQKHDNLSNCLQAGLGFEDLNSRLKLQK